MQKSLFLAVLILFATSQVFAQSEMTNYKVSDKIKLKGDDGWDYLVSNDAKNQLFVTHGSEIQVVDEEKGAQIGEIPNTQGVHGVALVPEFNKGFATCSHTNSIIVFDMNSFGTIAQIQEEGRDPDAITYDPSSHYIFAFNAKSANAVVIDPKSNKIVAMVPLSGSPEAGVSDGKGKVYVNIEDKDQIDVIDVKTLSVVNHYKTGVGKSPKGLAIDKENNILFCTCKNRLMVILHADNGQVITSLPIGIYTDGAAFDNGLKRAYASCGDGTLTVVQEKKGNVFEVLTTVKTEDNARTMALNEHTHHIYLSYAESKGNTKDIRALKPNSFAVLDIEVK